MAIKAILLNNFGGKNNMFEDDDFFINDDELAVDNQLSLTDIARDNLLDSIIKSAKDMKDNLKFNEQTEATSNIQLLASYVDSLISLSSIEVGNLTEAEIQEEIDNILRKTTELTFSNIDNVIPDENSEIQIEESDEDADGTDW